MMGLLVSNGNVLEKAGTNTVFSFRIDDTVYAVVKMIAEHEKRSINKQLEIFVENAVAEYVENQESAFNDTDRLP